jgi:hypothetical protein
MIVVTHKLALRVWWCLVFVCNGSVGDFLA